MRSLAPTIAVLLFAGLTLGPVPARADEPADPDTEIARRHFELAKRHYEGSDYSAALLEFEAAHRVKPAPAFEYNIGRCHDRLEHLAEAIAHYQRYADVHPADEAEVAARIAVLQKRLADSLPPPERVPPTIDEKSTERPPPQDEKAPAVPEARPFPYVVPLVVGVAALAIAAAGTALVLTVRPQYDDLASGANRCARPCDPSLYSGLEARALAGYALWGVAGAAAAVDVVLWVLAPRRRTVEQPARTSWILAPFAGGAAVAGSF
ncbi:MAG: hypothetical protein EXR72_16005 [Myxococcales bacterium]|nr:hypothetical protein [Myxococcales bacterium]